MKRAFLTVVIAALTSVSQTALAEIISCDFSNETVASVKFIGTGRLIEFPNTDARDFVITTATSPILGGLQGNIGGTFVVGSITTLGNVEQAPVVSTGGVFSIDDGAGKTLTADLELENILVLSKLVGAMNLTADINLDNISYSGINTDLLGIKNGSLQTVVLSFQFATKKPLSLLMTPGQVTSTSYSGSLSAEVPEPSSCVLLGLAVLGLLGYGWRRRLG